MSRSSTLSLCTKTFLCISKLPTRLASLCSIKAIRMCRLPIVRRRRSSPWGSGQIAQSVSKGCRVIGHISTKIPAVLKQLPTISSIHHYPLLHQRILKTPVIVKIVSNRGCVPPGSFSFVISHEARWSLWICQMAHIRKNDYLAILHACHFLIHYVAIISSAHLPRRWSVVLSIKFIHAF